MNPLRHDIIRRQSKALRVTQSPCTVIGVVDRDALTTEALRLHARYVEEIVEGLGFCPWAAPARKAGRVQARVVLGRDPDFATTYLELEQLVQEPAIEIAFLIYPELTLGRIDFQHFAARVRAECGPNASAAFAIADFHPDAEIDFASAARMVPFVRRSPDPTLQIVRHAALASARRGPSGGTRFVDASALLDGAPPPVLEDAEAPLHARLAEENLETIRRAGPPTVKALSDAILRERDLSYARCGLPPSPWRNENVSQRENRGNPVIAAPRSCTSKGEE